MILASRLMDGIYMKLVFLPPERSIPPPPMYVPSTQGSLRATPESHRKSYNFKPLRKSSKIMKNCPKAIQNQQKWTLESWKSKLLRKVCFCNTFHTKAAFCEPQVPGFWLRNRCRKGNGTEPKNNTRFLALGARKPFKMGSQNHDRIDKDDVTLDPHASFLLLPRSLRVPPICQNSPKAAKTEAPGSLR